MGERSPWRDRTFLCKGHDAFVTWTCWNCLGDPASRGAFWPWQLYSKRKNIQDGSRRLEADRGRSSQRVHLKTFEKPLNSGWTRFCTRQQRAIANRWRVSWTWPCWITESVMQWTKALKPSLSEISQAQTEQTHTHTGQHTGPDANLSLVILTQLDAHHTIAYQADSWFEILMLLWRSAWQSLCKHCKQ